MFLSDSSHGKRVSMWEDFEEGFYVVKIEGTTLRYLDFDTAYLSYQNLLDTQDPAVLRLW